jgi:drug/metabolite transporter (DMT)-like permease
MERSRTCPSAHIGILFSGVVNGAHLSFFTDVLDSHFIRVPAVTPPPAIAARLDSISVPVPEKKQAVRRAPARVDHPFKGIALILLSTVFLGCSDVTAKYLSTSLPSIEITWIRFLTFALIFTPVMAPVSPLYAMHTKRLGLQLMRGAALLGSSLFFITGLRFLPIAEASATGFVSPLFVTALSIIFLSEKVGLRRWLATALGLVGVMIILRPGSSAFHVAAFFPIVSAFCWAAALILTRMISGREAVVTTMAYSALTGIAILTAMVPFVWVTPSWNAIALGVFIGIASTVGQWIVVLAYRYGDASVLAPFSYTQLLWVSILGFFLFGELPDVWTVTGAAFIVASGLYIAHRERIRRAQLLVLEERSPNA